MSASEQLPGLAALWQRTHGDPRIRVAVLDGWVDRSHLCFDGADLVPLDTLFPGRANPASAMAAHGTHVASVLFGQPGTAVEGLVPRCQGLLIPVFSDDRRPLSQLDLARAINQAVEAGAQVINISGGQQTEGGTPSRCSNRRCRCAGRATCSLWRRRATTAAPASTSRQPCPPCSPSGR